MSGLQLLAPIGLLALIGIPLVIFFHMRHTTPVEKPVPTLRFWQMVAPAPTDDARFRRPPISLLLLLQLLAVGALGLALARPAVADAWAGLTQRTEPKHLVILIDGSTSMAAIDTDTGEDRFAVAKRLALQRIDDLRDGDVATVMVLGSAVRSFEATDSAGLRALEERLQALSLPGGRADLNSALALTGNLMVPDLDNYVVVITDSAVAADPAVVAEVGAPIELVQVGLANSANLAVVQLAARASGDTASETAVFARLANFSDSDVNATVSIFANDVEVETRGVSIAADSVVDFLSDALPTGVSRLRIELRSNVTDALPADNAAELVLARGSDLAQRILLVSDTPLVLQRALNSLDGAQVTIVSTTEHLSGNVEGGPFDLFVFENYTPVSAAEITAPVFFVHPPVDGLLPATGMMTAATVQHVRSGDPLLKDVDLTGLAVGEVPIHELSESDVEVAEGESGPLLYRGVVPGSDKPMVVLTFDLQENTLTKRIAFPILMANVVRTLAPAALPASAALGDPLALEPRAGAATVRVIAPSAVETDIPVTTDAAGALETAIYPSTGAAGEYIVQELDSSGRIDGVRIVRGQRGPSGRVESARQPRASRSAGASHRLRRQRRCPATAGRALAGPGGPGAWSARPGVAVDQCWRRWPALGARCERRTHMNLPFDLTFARSGWLWLLLLVPLVALVGYLVGRRRGVRPASIWLRVAAMTLLILALSEPLWSAGAVSPATVIVVDRSDSLSSASTTSVVDWLNSALGAAGSGDRAAIVSFGGNAVVDQPAGDAGSMMYDAATGEPIDTSTTDIAGALAMARALPVGDARRIVLISDGAENSGSALDQAVQAASEDTPIDVLAIDGIGSQDLRIDGVSAPEKVWQGESMTVQASVVASEEGSGTVALLVDGATEVTQDADFRIGLNTYTFTVDDLEPGFHQMSVAIDPGSTADAFDQNNVQPFGVVVRDAPHLLFVAQEGADNSFLIQQLEDRGVQITEIIPTQIPERMSELSIYDAIVLDNIPASDIDRGADRRAGGKHPNAWTRPDRHRRHQRLRTRRVCQYPAGRAAPGGRESDRGQRAPAGGTVADHRQIRLHGARSGRIDLQDRYGQGSGSARGWSAAGRRRDCDPCVQRPAAVDHAADPHRRAGRP